MTKQEMFKTAKATVSCAHFKAGDIVSLEWSHKLDGVDWYYIKATENGPTSCVVAYPAHHLTGFCF